MLLTHELEALLDQKFQDFLVLLSTDDICTTLRRQKDHLVDENVRSFCIEIMVI